MGLIVGVPVIVSLQTASGPLGRRTPEPDASMQHIARLAANRSLHRNIQSATLALRALIPPRLVLLSRRLFCELRAGRVAFRFARVTATRATRSRSRRNASSRF